MTVGDFVGLHRSAKTIVSRFQGSFFFRRFPFEPMTHELMTSRSGHAITDSHIYIRAIPLQIPVNKFS